MISSSRKGAAPGKEWEKYGSYFYYNQLNTAEKKFYDDLNTVCLHYLMNPEDAFAYDENSSFIDLIEFGNLSMNRAKEIMNIFRMSNPQYFFLNSDIWSSQKYQRVGFGIYKLFEKGRTRMQAKNMIAEQISAWEPYIREAGSDEEKVKIIHDLIIQKVDYAEGFDYTNALLDESYLSQCVFSVFCRDETVCAGYAQAFSMLCNGAGIDAVSVTSSMHQWNKVRINDSWYNVDCTWDDNSSEETYYLLFERSDLFLEIYGEYFETTTYVVEQKWQNLLPECTLDSAPDDLYTPGTLPVIMTKAAVPVIKITNSNGTTRVTITSSTKGAKIYYSTNGVTPSPAYVKCNLYTGTFTLEKGKAVKAISVCNEMYDSNAALIKCVTFDGNRATSGKVNDIYYTSAGNFVIPNNVYKKTGYVFVGWNTKADGTGTAYVSNQKIPVDLLNKQTVVRFYAQWKPVDYHITYKLKGGTNSGKNPNTYQVTDTINLKKPSRTGYTFLGWYTDKACKHRTTKIGAGSTGNKTLYAKWKVNTYTIVFKGNGSTKGKMPALKARKYGKTYRLSANAYRRSGYKFKGWSTKKNGKGVLYKNKQKVKNLSAKSGKKVVLYAVWKRVK